ncbi:uncharacterized protein A4U43_C04F29540 [Asparagus officinalis]|uniref:Uncharacterized protein n=1 Tax=Asparagus officinalis TaxID=4686 RepID=A0A5P1F4L1_ASPOF|nr:uncharacterized protein A4U43_C04F29540 [Asparagus officinalis]
MARPPRSAHRAHPGAPPPPQLPPLSPPSAGNARSIPKSHRLRTLLLASRRPSSFPLLDRHDLPPRRPSRSIPNCLLSLPPNLHASASPLSYPPRLSSPPPPAGLLSTKARRLLKGPLVSSTPSTGAPQSSSILFLADRSCVASRRRHLCPAVGSSLRHPHRWPDQLPLSPCARLQPVEQIGLPSLTTIS